MTLDDGVIMLQSKKTMELASLLTRYARATNVRAKRENIKQTSQRSRRVFNNSYGADIAPFLICRLSRKAPAMEDEPSESIRGKGC